MATLGQMAVAAAAITAVTAPQGASSMSIRAGIGQLQYQDTALSGTVGTEDNFFTSSCQNTLLSNSLM